MRTGNGRIPFHESAPKIARNSSKTRLLGLTNVSLKCSNYPSDDGRFNGRTRNLSEVIKGMLSVLRNAPVDLLLE